MKGKKEMCESSSCCDSSCCMWCGVVVLVAGLLYLLQDYGMALTWWRVGPWTLVFVLVGLKLVMKAQRCK